MCYTASVLNRLIQKRLRGRFESACLSGSQVSRDQDRRWLPLRNALVETAIGRDTGLKKFSSFREFQQRVAPREYADHEPYIDRMLGGEANVLFPGKPLCFGLTSGTTGKHGKKIPYNQAMLSLMARSRIFPLCSMVANGQKVELTRYRTLNIASSHHVETQGEFQLGYVSGILDQQRPWFLKRGLFPQKDYGHIEDWNQKLKALFEEIKGVDLKSISGVPAVVVEALKEFCRWGGVKRSSELWPNLDAFIYGGSDISNFRDSVEAIHGKKISHYGIYTSTESPIGNAFAPWEGQSKYLLNQEVLFSFNQPGENLVDVSELTVGEIYQVHVTTPSGFLLYPLKDEIRVLSLEPYFLFEPVGRQGGALNLATEKITERGINEAIFDFSQSSGTRLVHHMVLPYVRDGRPGYHFLLYTTSPVAKASAILDASLQERNQDYRESRETGVLGEVKVTCLSPDPIEKYLQERAAHGQLKVQVVFRSENEFREYCTNRLKWTPSL